MLIQRDNADLFPEAILLVSAMIITDSSAADAGRHFSGIMINRQPFLRCEFCTKSQQHLCSC